MTFTQSMTPLHTTQTIALRHTRGWWSWFVGMLGVCGFTGAHMVLYGPTLGVVAWLCYAIGVAAILYQPRYGVYLIIGLTLVGDAVLMYWYPFTKNLSSAESMMYTSRALIFSPLESYVVLTYLSWLGRSLVRRTFVWNNSAVVWATLAFAACISFGLVWGLGRGGNTNVALWEVRGMYMLPAMVVLIVHLVHSPAHINRMIWIAAIAIMIKSVVGVWFVAAELNFHITQVESIAEHPYSIHLCAYVVLTLAAWIYRASAVKRSVLTAWLPVVLFSLFANQRRAAFVALAVALLLLLLMLFIENRRAFFVVAPIVAVLAVGYVGAFWNASGTLGMPARAIKSAIAPDTVSARDSASDVYRILENINTMFTIKAAPLFGIGFGNKFYRIVALPDISFFVFYEYITHNSIMWVWMQMGVIGFCAMLFMVGFAIWEGVAVTTQSPPGDIRAIALAATLAIVMHFIFAYVDMSWDAANMIFVGTMIGIIAVLGNLQRANTPRTLAQEHAA